MAGAAGDRTVFIQAAGMLDPIFPRGDKFRNLHEQDQLSDPDDVATQLWDVLDEGLEPGTLLDLRKR